MTMTDDERKRLAEIKAKYARLLYQLPVPNSTVQTRIEVGGQDVTGLFDWLEVAIEDISWLLQRLDGDATPRCVCDCVLVTLSPEDEKRLADLRAEWESGTGDVTDEQIRWLLDLVERQDRRWETLRRNLDISTNPKRHEHFNLMALLEQDAGS